ncbi:MAG: hypothetical protein ACW981_18340 [Candidatus Hodarchaeales archaeon]|jgi:hypothetical protein
MATEFVKKQDINQKITILFILSQFLNSFVLIMFEIDKNFIESLSFLFTVTVGIALIFTLTLVNLYRKKYVFLTALASLSFFFGEMIRYFPSNIFIYPNTSSDFKWLSDYFYTFEELVVLLPDNTFRLIQVIALEITFVILFSFIFYKENPKKIVEKIHYYSQQRKTIILNKENNKRLIQIIIAYAIIFLLVTTFYIISTNIYLAPVDHDKVLASESNLILSRNLTFFLPILKGTVFFFFYRHFSQRTNVM